MKVLTSAISQDKETSHLDWKKKKKPSFCLHLQCLSSLTNTVIVYDNSMEPTKNLLEQVNKFNNTTRYKINI